MQTVLLAIGIAHYQSDSIKDLTVCDQDAQAIATTFHDIAGDKLQQRVLLNERATKQGIQEGIEWLAQTAKKGDLAVFYYSGHGANAPDDNGEEPDHSDELLCPHDCGTESGLATFIRDDELRTWLGAVTKRTDHVVIILDSCHSGTAAMAAQRSIPKEVPPEVVRAILGDAKLPKGKAGDKIARGQVLLAGCQDAEQSYILRGAANSVFTTCIVQALQDRSITTFQALYAQVVPQVANQIEPLGLQQNPNLVDGTSGEVAFR